MEIELPQQQEPIIRDYSSENISGWLIFSLTGRVDSFNFPQARESLLELSQQSPSRMAIDLQCADFLSFPFIKVMAEVAQQLNQQGYKLSLVSPSEKLKRQIDIYASLDEMRVFRSRENLLSFQE